MEEIQPSSKQISALEDATNNTMKIRYEPLFWLPGHFKDFPLRSARNVMVTKGRTGIFKLWTHSRDGCRQLLKVPIRELSKQTAGKIESLFRLYLFVEG